MFSEVRVRVLRVSCVLCVSVSILGVGSVASGVPVARATSTKADKIEKPRGEVPHVKRGQNRHSAEAGTNPQCTRCSPPLINTPGRLAMGGGSGVPGHIVVTPVYWSPPGYGYTASYRSIVNGYIADL